MTRVAAVDCGTNSIRLLVADVAQGHLTDVERVMRIVRLGEGVDRTGVLSPQALERTAVALEEYAATCARLEVTSTRLVATSATRDARNSAEFVDLVERTLHVTPDIVSGDEEAALSFAGATAGLTEPAPYLVLDIGGGSTELVLGNQEPEAAFSMDIGCVRLTERQLTDDPPSGQQVDAAVEGITAALQQALAVVPADQAATAIGLAGSVTTVAAIALGLASYDPDRLHHSRLSRSDAQRVSEQLLTMTRAQRAALPVMHPGRVDVIGAGALILATVMGQLGLAELLVSETDILDGIALSIR